MKGSVMHEDVLIPTDGSDKNDKVVDYAIGLANLTEATIHALSVIDDRALRDLDEELEETVSQRLESKTERWVTDIAETATSAGLETVTEVRRGDPSSQIIQYADENEIDLIVMGGQGADHRHHENIGSVSERVVSEAPCPVTLRMVGDE